MSTQIIVFSLCLKLSYLQECPEIHALCGWWVMEACLSGEIRKAEKSSYHHPELSLQDSLRLANRSTMGICIFIDKWSTQQTAFGERKKGVNRHSTEIVAKKMWRRSSHVLRPKKVVEDSNYWRPAMLAIQRRRASKTGKGPRAEVGKKKLWVQEIRAWAVWETLKSPRFPMLWLTTGKQNNSCRNSLWFEFTAMWD